MQSPSAVPASGWDHVEGYVADSAYPSLYHRNFSPAWIDTILRRRGIAPPRAPRGRFTHYDLGCGDGIGLILNAAAYPEARFVGLDALPCHAARGTAVAAETGIGNVELRCATFAEAVAEPGREGWADYVTAQGVLAWVSPENRTALFELAARALRPGGVFVVGYNALPGWGSIIPFQRAIRTLAGEETGGTRERFERAVERVRALDLFDDSVWTWFDKLGGKLPADYFAHEYLNASWSPLWSSDVIATARTHDLRFVGESKAEDGRDDLGLKADWRRRVDQAGTIEAKELLRDLLIKCWFRQDIYVKAPVPSIDEEQARAARLDAWFTRSVRTGDQPLQTNTSAGTIRFDNEAARAILDRLRAGPAALRSVSGYGEADLLNAIDALLIGGFVLPSEPPATVPGARRVNDWLLAEAERGSAATALVGRNGVVPLRRAQLKPDFLTASASTLGLEW